MDNPEHLVPDIILAAQCHLPGRSADGSLQVPLQSGSRIPWSHCFPPTVKGTDLKFNILAGSLFVTKRAEIIAKQAQLVK